MLIQERLYTAAEFWEIVQQPENEDRWLELDEGEIIEMGSSRQINTVIAMRFGRFLGNFVDEHKLGYVTGADSGFTLAPNIVRRPDVGYISKDADPVLDGVDFPVAPDLAVEVVSPNEKLVKKVHQYIKAGTRLVWTVYPEDKMVYVWRPAVGGGVHVQAFEMGDVLDGGDVLPGFTLALKDGFSE